MIDYLTSQHQENARVVELLYDFERTKNLAAWLDLWHPSGRQTFPWAQGEALVGIDALRNSTRRKFETRENIRIDVDVMPMADPSWVFAAAQISIFFTELGRTIEGELWCRFHFDDSGLILEHQEVFDTSRLIASKPSESVTGAGIA